MGIVIGYVLLDDEFGESQILGHFLSPDVMDVIEDRLYPDMASAQRALRRGGPFTNPARCVCGDEDSHETVFMYAWYARHQGGSGKAYWWVAEICQACRAVVEQDTDTEITNITTSSEAIDALIPEGRFVHLEWCERKFPSRRRVHGHFGRR